MSFRVVDFASYGIVSGCTTDMVFTFSTGLLLLDTDARRGFLLVSSALLDTFDYLNSFRDALFDWSILYFYFYISGDKLELRTFWGGCSEIFDVFGCFCVCEGKLSYFCFSLVLATPFTGSCDLDCDSFLLVFFWDLRGEGSAALISFFLGVSNFPGLASPPWSFFRSTSFYGYDTTTLAGCCSCCCYPF